MYLACRVFWMRQRFIGNIAVVSLGRKWFLEVLQAWFRSIMKMIFGQAASQHAFYRMYDG